MQGLAFHEPAQDNGHFYVLAYCEGTYGVRDERIPSRIAMNFSPSATFSRFSFQVYTLDGSSKMYHRGPDSPSSVEAALLDIWVQESVPAYAWRLFPREDCASFVEEEHKVSYFKARSELCVALWPTRMNAWAQRKLNVPPLFHPPTEGFIPVNVEQSTDQEEMLQAALTAAA